MSKEQTPASPLASQPMHFYGAFTKVDEEQRMVYGVASTETRDSQGEVVTKDAIKDAWEGYMKFANIREMHQPSAVGIVKEYAFTDAGVEIGVQVVDDSAWNKVKKQVYKGFSIGGRKTKFDKVAKTIEGMELTEISLVDRPANPDALISVFKMDGEPGPTEISPESKAAEAEAAKVAKAESDKLAAEAAAAGTSNPNPDEGLSPEAIAARDSILAKQALANGTAAPMPAVATTLAAASPAQTSITLTPEDLAKFLSTADGLKLVADAVAKMKTEAPAAVKKNRAPIQDIVKTFGAGPAEIRKGLYAVQCFANLIQDLAWLQSNSAMEEQYEGDSSDMPNQLMAAAKNLGALLVQMVQEEVKELFPEAMSIDIVQMFDRVDCETDNGVVKLSAVLGAMDTIAKAGARNSKADAADIQKAHDLMAGLGATCAGEAAKVAKPEDVAKHGLAAIPADAAIAKIANNVSKLAKAYEDSMNETASLRKSVAMMQKMLDETAVPAKGVSLRVVGKGVESVTATEDGANEVAPVLNADGTVDVLATEMKKAQATPIPLGQLAKNRI